MKERIREILKESIDVKKAILENQADTIGKIVKEGAEELAHAPISMSVKRVDEVSASRKPILTWKMAIAEGKGGQECSQ